MEWCSLLIGLALLYLDVGLANIGGMHSYIS